MDSARDSIDLTYPGWPVRSSMAGEVLRDAAEQLVEVWLEDVDAAPSNVGDVVNSFRSVTQKIVLLRLLALHALLRASQFEMAVMITQCLDERLSWTELAQRLGRSRQALHRQHNALVHQVRRAFEEGGDDALADIATTPDLMGYRSGKRDRHS